MNVFHETPFGIFEWDSEKNQTNIRKHGLDFSDAVRAFQDEYGLFTYDDKHSEDEDRYTLTGKIENYIVVLVVFTERHKVQRIISARLATKNEVKNYERQAYRY